MLSLNCHSKLEYWDDYLNISLCTTHILIRKTPKMKWREFNVLWWCLLIIYWFDQDIWGNSRLWSWLSLEYASWFQGAPIPGGCISYHFKTITFSRWGWVLLMGMCTHQNMWCDLLKSVWSRTCNISVFYFVEVFIWDTFCSKPHNQTSGSTVMRNWRLVKTIENKRN